MPSLLDIGKLTAEVEIRGVQVEVGGLSGTVFLELLDDFPELRKVMAAGAPVDIDPSALLQQVPGAMREVLIQGLLSALEQDGWVNGGYAKPGQELLDKLGNRLDRLMLGEQADLMLKIWELTFPRGIKSFMDALERMAGDLVGARGWDQATRSPEQ